mgnify:CR=1 FL=1|jgi:hypothetical protein
MEGAAPTTRIIKITKSGFGSAPGQIPTRLQAPLMLFDFFNEAAAKEGKAKTKYVQMQEIEIKKRKTNATFRCPRKGFVPFDVMGRLTVSARDDGVPSAGEDVVLAKDGSLLRAPLYLVLSMIGEFVAALALLYMQPDRSLKLEYLCAAPRFKGSGSTLLKQLADGALFREVVEGVKGLYLNDDSGIPGYYAKRGFRVVGKTKPNQYKMKDPSGKKDSKGKSLIIDKILNVYKASYASKTAPPKRPPPKPRDATRVRQTRRKPRPPLAPRYRLRTRVVF